jgi:hypothetical protein
MNLKPFSLKNWVGELLGAEFGYCFVDADGWPSRGLSSAIPIPACTTRGLF